MCPVGTLNVSAWVACHTSAQHGVAAQLAEVNVALYDAPEKGVVHFLGIDDIETRLEQDFQTTRVFGAGLQKTMRKGFLSKCEAVVMTLVGTLAKIRSSVP